MRKPNWLFSWGAGGHAILDNLFAIFFLYFLLPPVESGLPERLDNQVLFLGVTSVGLLVLLGRFSDALMDPLLAWWSDRSRSRWGRRRFFLLTAPLPFAILALALFLTPVAHPDPLNFWWEVVALTLFFLGYTWYLVPYLALMPELTRGREERLSLATWQAVMTLVGAFLVMGAVPQLRALTGSFVLAIGSVIAVALVLLFVPALVVREPAGRRLPSEVSFFESVRKTLANRAFLWYLGGKICLFTAFNILRATVAYYPEVLLGKPASFLTWLLAAAFGSAVLWFFVVRLLAKRVSNKALMLSALVAFAVLLNGGPLILMAGSWAVPLAFVQMLLLGWPLAVLLVIPNAMVADLAEAETLTSGERHEAQFYGTQGLFVKIAYGLAAFFVGFLFATYGKDAAHPVGVVVAGSLGAGLALLGTWSMAKFPQKAVDAVLASDSR